LNLLVGGAGAGAYWMVVRDAAPARETHGRDEGTSPAVRAEPLTFDVPEMLVALTDVGGQASRLRISFTLEVADQATIERLRTVMPLVIDNFQVYLRQLAVEDLSGSAGTARLREDLLLRVNAAIRPAEVQDVRVAEMEVR
jgi:flagellar FliL protein